MTKTVQVTHPLAPCGTSAVAHLKWFSTSDANCGPVDANSQHCQSPLKKQVGIFSHILLSQLHYVCPSLAARLDLWILSTYLLPTSSTGQLISSFPKVSSTPPVGIPAPDPIGDMWQWLGIISWTLTWRPAWGCCWCVVGTDQGYCSTTYSAQCVGHTLLHKHSSNAKRQSWVPRIRNSARQHKIHKAAREEILDSWKLNSLIGDNDIYTQYSPRKEFLNI